MPILIPLRTSSLLPHWGFGRTPFARVTHWTDSTPFFVAELRSFPLFRTQNKSELFITCFFILFVGYSYLLKRAADRRKNLSPLPLQEQWNYLLPLLALSMGIPAIKVWRFSPNRSEPFCPSRKDSCAGSLGLGNLSFMLPLFMNPRMSISNSFFSGSYYVVLFPYWRFKRRARD